MNNVNNDHPAQNSEESVNQAQNRFSAFCRDASLLAGSIYGNGYATMYGPPLVKNGIKTYLNTCGPSYVGSGIVHNYVAFTQAASLAPYLGTVGGVVGGAASLLAYKVVTKVAEVAANTLYSAVAAREVPKNAQGL